jgi:hypothetical protein
MRRRQQQELYGSGLYSGGNEEDEDGSDDKESIKPPAAISIQEHFTRFYYNESIFVVWVAAAISVMAYGVLVHINLDHIIGVCIMLDGLALLVSCMLGVLLWLVFGEFGIEHFIRWRKMLVALKVMLLLILVGLSIWAAVMMIQKSSV